MSKITLRDYQIELIRQVRAHIAAGRKSILVQLATGGGKTALASKMVETGYEKRNRILFTVHRRDLIKQTSVAFDDFSIPYGYIAAGYDLNPFGTIYICSIDTLKNRLTTAPLPKVIFVDECHLANSEGWSKVINFYRQKGVIIIGLSATPWRLDGSGLGKNFEVMVCGPSMQWLIDNGYLSTYRYFAPSTINTAGIKITMGDYNRAQLAERMEGESMIVGDAIHNYQKYAGGMRAICYCVSRKHSERVARQFSAAGIPAAHIDGETLMSERARLIGMFADGRIMVLCNVELITTGFDLAAQVGRDVTVECAILLRPTKSLSLFLQMVGRALRKKDYPAIILDHAGCAFQHGLPADERVWSLESRDKKKGGGGALPTKQCEKCFYVHSPAPSCPNCGNVYEIKYREIDEVDGELSEMTESIVMGKTGQIFKNEIDMARTLDELIKIGERRREKQPALWAAKEMSKKLAARKGR